METALPAPRNLDITVITDVCSAAGLDCDGSDWGSVRYHIKALKNGHTSRSVKLLAAAQLRSRRIRRRGAQRYQRWPRLLDRVLTIIVMGNALAQTSAYAATAPTAAHPPAARRRRICAYADSDLAGCVNTRKSRTGFIVMMAGAMISKRSALQTTIVLSTCAAEIVALNELAD